MQYALLCVVNNAYASMDPLADGGGCVRRASLLIKNTHSS